MEEDQFPNEPLDENEVEAHAGNERNVTSEPVALVNGIGKDFDLDDDRDFQDEYQKDNDLAGIDYQHQLDDLTSTLLDHVTEDLNKKGLCGDGSYNADSVPVDKKVIANSTPEHLSKDTKNLLFSHFPRNLGTEFRFKVGELAYISWHDELCLVIINFASQKLVACSDDAFDEPTESLASGVSEAIHGQHELQQVQLDAKILETIKNPASKRSIWLYDKNEDLFVDADSHEMYSRRNAIQPLEFALNHYGPDFRYQFDNLNGVVNGYEMDSNRMLVRSYFMPIYFVTFPGYKKRCARTFRFWVKEKDLIKLHGVDWSVKVGKKPSINYGFGAGNTLIERIWAGRSVEDINEYVYSVVHNKFYNDIVSGKYHNAMVTTGSDLSLPWNVPRRLRDLVSNQQHNATLAGATLLADPEATIGNEIFSAAPFLERTSANALVQNFKYILLIIGNLIRRTHDMVAIHKSGDEFIPGPDTLSDLEDMASDIELDEMCIPSMRLLDHLEGAIDGNLTYQQFFDIYINNVYWLDFYLEWINVNFLNYCCYNEHEYKHLVTVQQQRQVPLSKILGLEHFSRLFCFDVLYKHCLNRLLRSQKPFVAYLPITQLLVQYLALVADDYCHNQEYGTSGKKKQ
ncbi:hypothetical protein BdWA1_002879 [Babesia duncani]|uniref:Uncharacterized protein n=1 Tax=Babesia duncani TaxID=323732 RepID=A0AAD9UMZ0_9APIC|nr:hypothetical protein BdWA1_002879 [Babesia duncani]